ncbi:antitoxin Xre/MbcA/ParS toxin-binding domain-containing protein [Novosphingobium sp. PP1Y]|uniref:antitoxin Xre/MbcA/ParS toxin-binding domain-containing protein n=1 Tax=Novosphingobium sp. PP1Y TaxID=702113 RepID=UPI00020EFB83|nr:antitoxin Xre/MbcA/ParS toxin-binding domain-containing protein [Novosphingobium sp. PP1Y]CCA90723.1 conserved hypothetical protein [Novosphingobium sp. PP1Y]
MTSQRPDLTSRITPRTAPAGLRTFFNIARCWDLSSEQEAAILGAGSRAELERWRELAGKETGSLPLETVLRIGHILVIFRLINTLLGDPARADAWMRKPNSHPLFGGASAIDTLARGRLDDLLALRRYLTIEAGP